MIASLDFAGIANVIKELTLLITAIGILIVGYRTSRKVSQIDAAVNGKAPGAATIGDEVTSQVAVLPLLRTVAADVKVIKAETPTD